MSGFLFLDLLPHGMKIKQITVLLCCVLNKLAVSLEPLCRLPFNCCAQDRVFRLLAIGPLVSLPCLYRGVFSCTINFALLIWRTLSMRINLVIWGSSFHVSYVWFFCMQRSNPTLSKDTTVLSLIIDLFRIRKTLAATEL